METDCLVVGGGIAGLYGGLALAESGKQVTVIEQSEGVGGVIRSTQGRSGATYDFGTHYIIETEVAEIDELLLMGLDDSNCVLFQESLAETNYFDGKLAEYSGCIDARSLDKVCLEKAQEEIHQIAINNPAEIFVDGSLHTYLLANYGEVLTEHIFRDAFRKLTGKQLEELPPGSISTFHIERLILFDEHECVSLKEKYPGYDLRIAYNDRTINQSKVKKYYPREGGIQFWPSLMQENLLTRGGQVFTGTSVSQVEAHQAVLSSGETIEFKDLYWTLPPALLAATSGNKDLAAKSGRPPSVEIAFHFLQLDRPTEIKCHYTCDYDPSHCGYRFTFFSNILPGNDRLSNVCIEEPLHDFNAEKRSLLECPEFLVSEILDMGFYSERPQVQEYFRSERSAFLPLPDSTVHSGNEAIIKNLKNDFNHWHFLGAASLGSAGQNAVIKDVHAKVNSG
jgi:protoporphyrinogen oxidase